MESNFFFILPLLLSQQVRFIRLTWGVAGFVVCWTASETIYNFVTQPEFQPAYGWINDLLGVFSVLVIAFFIVRRTQAERDLNSIIDFVDGRTELSEDNRYLRAHR